MGAVSQAQVQLLVTARSEAQAVLNQTATGVKAVTDAVQKNTDATDTNAKTQALVEQAQQRATTAMETWARQMRIAQFEVANLTAEEKVAIQNAKTLAISTEEVAAALGVSAVAVKAYQATIKQKNDVEDESAKKSKGLNLAIGGTVAVVAGAILSATSYADRLGELSDQTGIGVVALQKFAASALTNGASLEKLTGAYGFFQNAVEAGSKGVSDALGRLGIDYEQLKQQAPEDQMRILAEAVGGVEDPTERARVATELFGKSGRLLIPTLQDIAKNYDKLPAVSADLIAKTGKLADTVDLLKQAGQGMLVEFLAPLIDHVNLTTDDLRGLLNIVPNVQYAMATAFAKIAIGVYETERSIVSFLLTIGEIEQKIPGMGHAVDGQVESLRTTLTGLNESIDVNQRTVGFLMQEWAHATDVTKSADLANVKASGTVVTMTEKLAAARGAVNSLSAAQREQINAGLAMHEGAKELLADLNKQYPTLKFTADALKLYEEGLKSSAKAQKEADAPAAGFQKTLEDLASKIEQAKSAGASSLDIYEEFGKELIKDSNLARLLGIDVGTISENLQHAMEDAHAFNLSAALAKNETEMQKQLSKIIEDRMKLQNQVIEKRNADEVKGNEQALALAQQYEDAKAKLTLTGVNYQIYQADRWLAVEKSKLDTRSSAYQTNVNQIEAIHALMVQQIIRASDPMFQMWNKIKDQVISLGKDINDDFAKMLTGAESFHDGFSNIWDSIRKTATNVLGDILQYFEKVFIARMTASLLGGGSVWSQIIGQALNTGAASGVSQGINIGTQIANASAYGAGGTGGGGGGAGVALAGGGLLKGGASGLSLAGHTASWGAVGSALAGPAAGAAVGFTVGRVTGNYAAGVASGAGTGAAVGAMMGGPVGAGVGAGVGALAGWYGAHKANEDARNQMVEIRDQLKQTFGSLDEVRKMAGMVGVNIDQAFQDIGRGVKGTEDFNKVVGQFQDKYTALDSAMKRYGLTVDDITNANKAATDQTKDLTSQIQADYTALTGAGLTPTQALTKMSSGFNDLLQTAQSTGSKLPASLEPLLQKMNELGLISDATRSKLLGLTDENTVDLQKASDIAQKYGITLAQLGPQFQQAQISAQAKDIFADFSTLKDMGVDVGGVLGGMSDEISQFVINAKAAGAEVPDNMRPILEELIQNHQLIGENGDALTDLTGIKFGAPLADQFAPVTDAIHDLIDVLTGKSADSLPGALADGIAQMGEIARRSQIKIPVGYEYETLDVPNLPKAAKGIFASGQQGVATWFGEGGEAELGGPKSFMQDVIEGVDWSKVKGGGGGGGGVTNNINLTMPLSPGVSLQTMMAFIKRDFLPAFHKLLDSDGTARNDTQKVLGV